MQEINNKDLEKLGEQVFGTKPKKRKFSKTFYILVTSMILLTFFSSYTFKKAGKDLGFKPSEKNFIEIIIENIQLLF